MFPKFFVLLLVCMTFADVSQAGRSRRCVRAMAFCTVEGVREQYDKCLELCCGGQLVEREATNGCCGSEDTGFVYDKVQDTCCAGETTSNEENIECCGNEIFGELYDKTENLCCPFFVTQSYKLHDIETNQGCCGTEPIVREGNNNNKCCIDYQTGETQEFDDRVEMCCIGKVGRVRTTAYGECCRDVAYTRDIASCPCHNGMLINATREFTGCCSHGNTREPYVFETQDCCEGKAFDKETEFCCGPENSKIVGSYETHYCCNDILINKTAEQSGESLGCCEIDGQTETIDATTQICCGGSGLFDKVEGDTCCGDQPFFDLTRNCCNNTLYNLEEAGSGCCNDAPFDGSEYACCGEEGPQGPFRVPACCVNEPYDSYTNTCCGATVYPNPLMGLDVSHHTRCCGDPGIPETLFPYDYLTQTCCNETIVELDGVSWDNHGCCNGLPYNRESQRCCGNEITDVTSNSIQCCGDELYDANAELCCNDVKQDKLFEDTSQCCNDTVMDSTDSLCCDSNLVDDEFDNTECCGGAAMDSDELKCCDGEPRSLNGVDKSVAICCGDACVDGGYYWCCDGKAYYKGATSGEVLDSLNCLEEE